MIVSVPEAAAPGFVAIRLPEPADIRSEAGMATVKCRVCQCRCPVGAVPGHCDAWHEVAAGNDSGYSVVEVTGAFDGEFYQVKGSQRVEEIAYTFESGCIFGTGRKQGTVVLREVVSLLDPDALTLALSILQGGKELPLGNAVFRRV